MERLQPVPWAFTEGDHDSRMKVNNLTLNLESEKGLLFTSYLTYTPLKNLTFSYKRSFIVFYNDTIFNFESSFGHGTYYTGHHYNSTHTYLIKAESPLGEYTFQEITESTSSTEKPKFINIFFKVVVK